MVKELKLDFIDGAYSAEEARAMLVRLFYNEIQFHCNEKFSKQIRLGIEDNSHDEISEELSTLIDRVKSFSNSAAECQSKLVVKGTIEIKFCE